MLNIALFVGGDLNWFTTDFDYFVGVDRGCMALLDRDLPLDLAVGDFDSVSTEDWHRIRSHAVRLIQAPAEKDDTDTELALKTIFQQFPQAQVTIFGAFGGRLDHLLSNLFLASDPNLAPYMGQIVLRDQQNHISYRPSGEHRIVPVADMVYVSFLQEGVEPLIILDAKYELRPEHYFCKKIYSSNCFLDKPIRLIVPDGYAIVLQTKDRR